MNPEQWAALLEYREPFLVCLYIGMFSLGFITLNSLSTS